MNTTTPANATITMEALEALATQLEDDDAVKRDRLRRLCTAYARILAAREPAMFKRRARHHGDEAGHYDNSYPPEQVYGEMTGPRALKVAKHDTEDVATSGGYYHTWRRVTTYGGLYLAIDGRWLRADETGEGRVGQFAAYPGDCSVDCKIDWETVDADDLSTEELVTAEARLRALTFPAAVAAASKEATAS